MFKTAFCMIALTLCSSNALAQTQSAPLPLDVAQQRARFARAQMVEADQKLKAAEKKDKAARKDLEEAKLQAEKTDKVLQEARTEATKWRELHDQAYQDLKRAHDAMQQSTQAK